MAAKRLTIDGSTIRKPNGNVIRLHGVNWGTWGTAAPEDAPALVAMHGNCVRLLLRIWGKYDGAPDTDALDWNAYAFVKRANFQRVLSEIKAATDAGLWVVVAIDSDCGQSGTQAGGESSYCDPNGIFGPAGRNFFTDYPMRGMFKAAWKQLAAALLNHPNIAAFELLPEPLADRGKEWAPAVAAFYRDMIEAVREVDADTPFLIGGRGYAAAYCEDVYLPERADVIYTGNLLSGIVTNPDKLASAIDSLVSMRDTFNVPILVQQVGRNSDEDRDLSHMESALAQLNAAGLHYTWWQYKQNGETPDAYGLYYKDGQGGWIPKPEEIALLTQYLAGA